MTSKLLLFDEVERDYFGPSGYSEPRYAFLNRAARPFFDLIRQTLQEWFDHFAAEEKKRENLSHLFRSENNTEHLGAFFELYLHQLMTQLGFKVEVEPEWPSAQPDFLLTASTGQQILLEATSTFPSIMFGSKKVLENLILDEIDKRVNSPDFFLNVHINHAPEGDPPYARMCRFIEKELAKLDPDQIIDEYLASGKREVHPRIPWNYESWDIEIVVSPKKQEARGKTGIRPIGSITTVEMVDPVSSIRESIKSKYKKFGDKSELPPYLIALNIHNDGTDDEDVFSALFGTEVTRVFLQESGPDQIIPGRELDGSWFSARGFQKTRISGLIVFKGLTPSQIGFRSPILWHHPAANKPLDSTLWRLDQKIPDEELRQYKMIRGEQAPDLLKIDREKLTRLASEKYPRS